MTRRYDCLQFWMQDLNGDWISLPLSEVAPSDIETAKAGRTVWEWTTLEHGRRSAIIGVGVRA